MLSLPMCLGMELGTIEIPLLIVGSHIREECLYCLVVVQEFIVALSLLLWFQLRVHCSVHSIVGSYEF